MQWLQLLYAGMKIRCLVEVISAALIVTSAIPASAGTIRVDVTVADANSGFSSPQISFYNLSDAGYQIVETDVLGAFSDHVINSAGTPIGAPAGGTYTPLGSTQISSSNPNDGCHAQNFSLTSFDPGDTFSYLFDPENNACANVVFDFRPRLVANAVTVTVDFTGPGIAGRRSLTGQTWVKETINPELPASSTNELYRLTLSDSVGSVPEPATGLLFGTTLLGMLVLLKRRRGSATASPEKSVTRRERLLAALRDNV